MFIGQIILNRRKELNMTQKQLAEKLNVTDRTISRWECGVSLPDVEMLKTVAKVLEVEINYFYEDVKEKEINYTEEYDYSKIKNYKIKSIIPFLMLKISIITTVIIESIFIIITEPMFHISNIHTMLNYAIAKNIPNTITILSIVQIISFLISVISFVLQSRNTISFKYFYKEKMYNTVYIKTKNKIMIPYIIVLSLSFLLMVI